MTAAVPAGDPGACTCGSGVWGTCDQCGADAWIKHHCAFPCDDVTCENGSLCIGCLTGRPCPVHNSGDGDWEDDPYLDRCCARCGDVVQYLASDDLCDGCAATHTSTPLRGAR